MIVKVPFVSNYARSAYSHFQQITNFFFFFFFQSTATGKKNKALNLPSSIVDIGCTQIICFGINLQNCVKSTQTIIVQSRQVLCDLCWYRVIKFGFNKVNTLIIYSYTISSLWFKTVKFLWYYCIRTNVHMSVTFLSLYTEHTSRYKGDFLYDKIGTEKMNNLSGCQKFTWTQTSLLQPSWFQTKQGQLCLFLVCVRLTHIPEQENTLNKCTLHDEVRSRLINRVSHDQIE